MKWITTEDCVPPALMFGKPVWGFQQRVSTCTHCDAVMPYLDAMDGCPLCLLDFHVAGTPEVPARWRWLPRSRWWRVWEKRVGQWGVR